jgi:predicted nucleic acid-binding protein
MSVVDASVWIDVLRDATGARRRRLNQLVDPRDVVLCRVTEMELLQGARDEHEWRRLAAYLDTQEYLEPNHGTWKEAARLFFDLRRQGLTIRSPMDCLIAQAAIEHRELLLHRDRDFETIARVRPLQQAWVEW